MLISVKHNFILLAMPKCGSTALEAAFGRYAEVKIGGTPELKHTNFMALEKYIWPFIEQQYRESPFCEPFSLFREPLEWLFSWYSYRGREELGASDGAKNYTGEISFSDFLNEHFKKKPASFAKVGRQSAFIENSNGDFDAVTLYRYEDIDFLAEELERRIGRSVPLGRKNISPKRDMELTNDEIVEARTKLRLEYRIYSSIPERNR